jgi:hypothetical protein
MSGKFLGKFLADFIAHAGHRNNKQVHTCVEGAVELQYSAQKVAQTNTGYRIELYASRGGNIRIPQRDDLEHSQKSMPKAGMRRDGRSHLKRFSFRNAIVKHIVNWVLFRPT